MNEVTLNNAGLISIAINLVLPLLVGLFTKSRMNSSVKAVILLLLSALATFLSQVFANGGVDGVPWKTAAIAAIVGFVSAVGVHFGFWKPTGATAVAQTSLVKENSGRVAAGD